MTERDEISAEELARAVEAAHRVRRIQPRATRFYWADSAVREVFADRLGIVGNAVPPRSMPLYYGLVSRIEAALWNEAKSPPPESPVQESPRQESPRQDEP